MNIISILFIVLGIITALIGFVAYKRRHLIIEMIRVRQASKMAIKDLERKVYLQEYEEALKQELPKAMRKKAQKDLQRKYDKTPLTEKLGKWAEATQKEVQRQDRNHKSGFESIMDDMNVFNTKTKGKKKSKDMWDL